jgi:hypothetical protein
VYTNCISFGTISAQHEVVINLLSRRQKRYTTHDLYDGALGYSDAVTWCDEKSHGSMVMEKSLEERDYVASIFADHGLT